VTVVGPSGLPPWVIAGVALGAVASVGVALVFYFGSRLSPPREGPGGDGSGGIGERRHAEIRAYLTAIDEQFHENHAVDGVSVPFYLPARNVAVTFDARDYFQLDDTDVYAVLCEHEMPGRGLGRRLPFDVSEPDRTSPAGRSVPNRSVADAFAELGLPPSADPRRGERRLSRAGQRRPPRPWRRRRGVSAGTGGVRHGERPRRREPTGTHPSRCTDDTIRVRSVTAFTVVGRGAYLETLRRS